LVPTAHEDCVVFVGGAAAVVGDGVVTEVEVSVNLPQATARSATSGTTAGRTSRFMARPHCIACRFGQRHAR
jgi:hypothetical protein